MGRPVEHDVEQYSPEWWRLRAGKATASRFGSIVSPETLKALKGGDTLALELAAERLIGGPLSMDDSRGDSGPRGVGRASEGRAAAWYELLRNTDTRTVGFVESADGKTGCSPDRLVDNDPEGPGGLEIKTPLVAKHVRSLVGEDVATITQVQGSLLVTGRKWWDVLSWTDEPALGPVLVRQYPVDTVQRILKNALAEFETKVEKALDMLRLLGRGGRVDGSDLKLQLLASLVHGVEPNPANLTLQEVSDFFDDVRRAERAGILDAAASASFIECAIGGDPAETRDHWASLKGSLEGAK